MEKKAFGFSTGALGRGDVKKALRVASGHATEAVEYSALRADELEPLVNLLLKQGAGDFRYVAVHAHTRNSTPLCRTLALQSQTQFPTFRSGNS